MEQRKTISSCVASAITQSFKQKSKGAVSNQPTMEDIAEVEQLRGQVNFNEDLANQLQQRLTNIQDSNLSFQYQNMDFDLAGFEDEVEQEIEDIWDECQQELEVEAEKRRKELEDLHETEAIEKHERLAEMKVEYNQQMRETETQEEKDRLEDE